MLPTNQQSEIPADGIILSKFCIPCEQPPTEEGVSAAMNSNNNGTTQKVEEQPLVSSKNNSESGQEAMVKEEESTILELAVSSICQPVTNASPVERSSTKNNDLEGQQHSSDSPENDDIKCQEPMVKNEENDMPQFAAAPFSMVCQPGNELDDEMQASITMVALATSPQLKHSSLSNSTTHSINIANEDGDDPTNNTKGDSLAHQMAEENTVTQVNSEKSRSDNEAPNNGMAHEITAKIEPAVNEATASLSGELSQLLVKADDNEAEDRSRASRAKDEPAISDSACAMPSRGKTLFPNQNQFLQINEAVSVSQLNKGASNDIADDDMRADDGTPAISEEPPATPLRGKVLPTVRKTLDQTKRASADKEVELINNGTSTADSIPLFDVSGNPLQYNENDVFVSLKHPAYKSFMFEQFKILGPTTGTGNKDAARNLLQRLKKGGGKFFKLKDNIHTAVEVDENEAFEKILRDVIRRNESRGQWHGKKVKSSSKKSQPRASAKDYTIPRKRREDKLVSTQSNGNSLAENHTLKPSSKDFDVIPNVGGRSSSRKRNRPQNFMDVQGQYMLVQEDLRQQTAAAKKKKKRGTDNFDRPFSSNENRQFELGCVKFGWDNWEEVQTLVTGRTSEECENYAAMIVLRHAGVKERLMEEHNQIWVNTEREKSSILGADPIVHLKKESVPTKPSLSSKGEGSMNVRKSGRAKTGTRKANDVANDTSVKKATKRTESKQNRSERKSGVPESGSAKPSEASKPKATTRVKSKLSGGERENDAPGIDSEPAVDDSNARRPKRQSAINARKTLKATLSNGDDFSDDANVQSKRTNADNAVDSHKESSSETVSRMNKLKLEKDDLLKGLSSVPSNKYYEEESAWRFHNPAFPENSVEQLTAIRGGTVPQVSAPIPPEQLQALPHAPPLPKLPKSNYCTWSFDEKSRVLLANFRDSQYKTGKGKIKVAREDEAFLFRMMERDDITVISEGLADAINSKLWTREYIEGCIGADYHHKVRGFETSSHENGPEKQSAQQPTEKKGWYSMKVSDYFHYLEQRRSVKSAKLGSSKGDECLSLSENFAFTDSDGTEKSVNVDKEALYMIDVDMVKLLPQAFEDLQRNFKLPGILPGGSHCMMNAVNANGRPFMGPNLYITPPASFTHFHQDGHGTVDSGHLCLSGYNEVVMLRRLTERHKCHALQLLTETSDSHSTLYGLPHRDDLVCASIGFSLLLLGMKFSSRNMYNLGNSTWLANYCPSVFILKPGQVVHINKGRLHAFRKLAPLALTETDCHSDLRNEVLEQKELPAEDICFSVAWDWMFKGVTADGINREVSGILECARLNRGHDLQSLAIPETSLLFLAKQNIAKHQVEPQVDTSDSLFGMDIPQRPTWGDGSEPGAVTVLRGILPSLQYVVNRHNFAVKFSQLWETQTNAEVAPSWRVSIDSKPNTWQDP
ncbi:hypothetical protein ACHAXR_007900, partial [Thalassiosira sp. AJA248-18]